MSKIKPPDYFDSLPQKRQENYAKKGIIKMIFRQALPQEINFIFSEGYKEWRKNRTFEQYCSDNAKEDVYGTRYVLDVDNEIVSSLIILKLKDIAGKKHMVLGLY
ncbi:MAG: hypothetical protein NHB14_04950 [Desulfosporosinus sp.]|nr:hypothetical protein [Desulfosporosinus sp.]